MKRTLLPALAVVPLLVFAGHAPLAPADARARELIADLHLSYLDGESGYFAVIGRSSQNVTHAGRELAAQSQIYYLLTAEAPTNYLHWLESDDTHVLLEGGPVDYFIFHPDGRAEKLTLGRDAAAGEHLVVAVPGGCWKALRLHPGAKFALMANVLSPEWTADRVRIGANRAFLDRFAGHAPWATDAFLRNLIGPNFTP
ncbi:MAG TPA: cupin domain-containing protein [Candidatus Didemnitutus sp.]